VGVAGEQIGDGSFEDAHAVAVDDADAVNFGEGGAVEEFVYLLAGFFSALADEVDLAEGAVEAGALAEGYEGARGGGSGGREHFFDVGRGHLHAQEAGVYL